MKMSKVRNQLVLNIFIIIAGIVFSLVLILGNVGRASASVAVIGGSYGEEYADSNKLNIVELSDSEKNYFDLRYEIFDYSVEDDGITIERYTGKSSELVIPETINSIPVTKIGKDFIEADSSISDLYIPATICEIQASVKENITIHCYDNTPIYQQYLADKEAETEQEGEDISVWKYEIIYDSDFVNYTLGDIPFSYNMNDDTVEITRYAGDEKLVIIPAYINGYPVTKISMNLLDLGNLVVIPDTVTSITGASAKLLYSPLFAIELIFSLLAILLSLITVNVLLPRYRKDNAEYMLTGSQIVSVVLYVMAQIGFAIASIYYLSITSFLALVISLVILAIFVLLVFSAGIGRGQVKEISQKIAEKTSRMDAIKQSAKELDGSKVSPETRKQLNRLVEEIRYSDPVSTPELDDIETALEKAIDDVKGAILAGDDAEIIKIIDLTKKLILKRSSMCKAGK